MRRDSQDRPSLIEILLATASALIMAWSAMPPQERYWLRLTITGKLRAIAAGLAAREGRAGMGDELAGRDPSQRYNVALKLSRARPGAGGDAAMSYAERRLRKMRKAKTPAQLWHNRCRICTAEIRPCGKNYRCAHRKAQRCADHLATE